MLVEIIFPDLQMGKEKCTPAQSFPASVVSRYSLIKYISIKWLRCAGHGSKCWGFSAEQNDASVTSGSLQIEWDTLLLGSRPGLFLFPSSTGIFSYNEEIIHRLQLWGLPYSPKDITEQFERYRQFTKICTIFCQV